MGVEIGLIYQCYGGVTDSNMVAFIRGEAENVQVNWSTTESTVNAKVTKYLLCFVYDDERGDKIP